MISHSLPLITTMATALGFALLMGFLAIKLKLPTLVGYLIAGIIIGPYTPGFVANAEIAAELAEIGVMLLMFGVGLHFTLDDLLETRNIALPGALLQIAVATCLGGGLAVYWGWNIGGALVFGLALSVASTVVLIKALESQGLMGTINGQIAVGWLVVEDLAMVLVLVFLPLLARWAGTGSEVDADQSMWILLGITVLKIAAFIVSMLWIGRWVVPKLLWHIARTGSRELFTLFVMVAAVSIAFVASRLFGMSLALGAFFAGMIIRESKFSRRAAENSLPFRDAFSVLFFVAVGMLFDPSIFIEHCWEVLAVTAIVVVGKSIAAALLVLAFRYRIHTSLIVSASLAQIGEFSFILAAMGVKLGLLPVLGQELILAGALISITMNPFIFKCIVPIQSWLRSRVSPGDFERSADPLVELPGNTDKKYLSSQVVLVGYGWVGRHIIKALGLEKVPCVVVEQNRELVEKLRKQGMAAVYGDAAEPNVLVQAHIAHAGILVLTGSDSFDIRTIIDVARRLNPSIEVAIRTEDEMETHLLKQEIDGAFFFSENELAKGMSRYILDRFGLSKSKKKK